MLFDVSLLPTGHPAPSFGLLDEKGCSLGLKDVQGKTGTVLLFFTSDWLGADLQLLHAYRDAHPELERAGLGIAAISGINWEKLHYLAKRLALPFPVLFDPCCRVSKQYQAMLIPKFVNGRAIYGLDQAGRIVFAQKRATPKDVISAFSG